MSEINFPVPGPVNYLNSKIDEYGGMAAGYAAQAGQAVNGFIEEESTRVKVEWAAAAVLTVFALSKAPKIFLTGALTAAVIVTGVLPSLNKVNEIFKQFVDNALRDTTWSKNIILAGAALSAYLLAPGSLRNAVYYGVGYAAGAVAAKASDVTFNMGR